MIGSEILKPFGSSTLSFDEFPKSALTIMRRRLIFKTFLTLLPLLLFLSPYAFGAEIKLALVPPTTNVDGSPATDLAGYRVCYGTTSRFLSGKDYENSTDVGNVTNHTLTNLTEGRTYFVAVKVYRTTPDYEESDYSNEVAGGVFTAAAKIDTDPPGLEVVVDSATYTAPFTFQWIAGSSHTVSVSSPQRGASGPQYVFSSWSDGGTREHAITAGSLVRNESSEATLTVVSIPAENLVGYWGFDEGAGNWANDASSYGNDGSVTGAVWTAGKVGKALVFDGVKGHVEIPNSPSLGFNTNQLSFAAWIYPADLSGDRVAIAGRARADLRRFDWQVYARAADAPTAYHPVFRVDLNGDGVISADEEVEGDAVLAPNTWYFISCTYDGKHMNFYIDGTVRGTSTKASGTIPNGEQDIWVGGNQVGGEYFQGSIDEVRLYNRALSQAEIQGLMIPGPPQYALTVKRVGNGSVFKNPDRAGYSLDTRVQLTATPNTGWLFDGWAGDLIGTKNPEAFVMSGDRTVTATFIQSPTASSITIQPANERVIEAQTATFNVVVSGFAPLSYQWQRWNNEGWEDIPGATDFSYTTPRTSLADNGARFRCLVTVQPNMTYKANFKTQ